MAMYYTILGMLLSAVPMVTGQFIIKGKKAIGGVLMDGMGKMGETLSGNAVNWSALDELHAFDKRREDHIANYAINRIGKAANTDMANKKKELDEMKKQQKKSGIGKIFMGIGLAVAAVACVAVLAFATALTGGAALLLAAGAVGCLMGSAAVTEGGMHQKAKAGKEHSKDAKVA